MRRRNREGVAAIRTFRLELAILNEGRGNPFTRRSVKCRGGLCGLTHSHASLLCRLAALAVIVTHCSPSTRLTGFTRAIIIYSSASLLLPSLSLSPSLYPSIHLFISLLPTSRVTNKQQVESLNMCRVVGRADDFWEASSRRLTWRSRGKRRPVITVDGRDSTAVQRITRISE